MILFSWQNNKLEVIIILPALAIYIFFLLGVEALLLLLNNRKGDKFVSYKHLCQHMHVVYDHAILYIVHIYSNFTNETHFSLGACHDIYE